MERIGIEASLNLNVSGTEDAKQLNEQLHLSEEQQKRLNELDAYNSNNQKEQQIQAQTQAFKEYTAAQEEAAKHLAENSTSTNYKVVEPQARRAYETEQRKPEPARDDYAEQARRAYDVSQKKIKKYLTEGKNDPDYAMQSLRLYYNAQQEQATEQMRKFPLYGNDSLGNGQQVQQQTRLQEINRISAKIDKLIDELDDIDDKYESAKQKDNERGMFNLAETRKSTETEKTSLEQKLKRLLAEQKDDEKGLGKYFGMKELQQAMNFAVQAGSIGNNYRMDIANGNYIGAGINKGESIGKAAGGVATSVGTALLLVPVPGAQVAGGVIAGTGMAVTGITELWASGKNADKAEAEAYEKMMSEKYGTNRLFNPVGNDITVNTKNANALISQAKDYSLGTGLSISDTLQYSNEMAKYGVTGSKTAMQYVQNAGKWNQETGADINSMLALQGMATRYGIGTDVISKAYGGLMASGMQKGQFNEYLQGLQQVIEDGIANGYTKSSEDIEKNLEMFTRLSGNNPLWQGQNVVNNIKQMNSGLSASTSMGNVSQVIAMGSAKNVVNGMSDEEYKKTFGRDKTGTYLDYEMALQNPNSKVYAQVLKDVQSYFGGNIAGQKETLQNIFGINSTGTLLDLINMTNKLGTKGYTEADIAKVINQNRITPNSYTEETKKSELVNSIQKSVQKIGESKFWEQYDELLKIAKDYDNKANSDKPNYQDNYGNTVTVKKGSEASAANVILSDDILRKISLPAGQGGTSYQNLMAKSGYQWNGGKEIKIGGNDAFDEIFKKRLAAYAAIDDGNISMGEVSRALTAHDSKEMQAAYNSGDKDSYISALEAMLTRLFGRLTVQYAP